MPVMPINVIILQFPFELKYRFKFSREHLDVHLSLVPAGNPALSSVISQSTHDEDLIAFLTRPFHPLRVTFAITYGYSPIWPKYASHIEFLMRLYFLDGIWCVCLVCQGKTSCCVITTTIIHIYSYNVIHVYICIVCDSLQQFSTFFLFSYSYTSFCKTSGICRETLVL